MPTQTQTPTQTIATQPTVKQGLTGTLSAQDYTTKTTPSWGETYNPAMAAYVGMDYVSIAFATDADKAAALIPKELQLVEVLGMPAGQAAANLVFAKYRACDLGPYMEGLPSTWITTQPCSLGASWAAIPRRWPGSQCATMEICT